MRVASKIVVWLLVPALTGCAHGRFQLADSSNSGASSDGSNGSSDGSKGSGDSSKDSGDSSKDSGDSSKDSGKSNSDNSSESRSETSGTVTTKGAEEDPDTTNAGALLLLRSQGNYVSYSTFHRLVCRSVYLLRLQGLPKRRALV